MKSIISTMILAAVFLGISIPAPAVAQEKDDPPTPTEMQIAIIDLDTIRRESTAMQQIREQIKKFRSVFQEEIQKEEEELRAANQELARQRTILSPDAFAEERKKFEDRLSQVQRSVQKRKTELDKSQQEAMNEVQKTLNQVVANVAAEKSIALVLRRDQIVLSATSLEITEEVLRRLNERLPKVTVPEPGN